MKILFFIEYFECSEQCGLRNRYQLRKKNRKFRNNYFLTGVKFPLI